MPKLNLKSLIAAITIILLAICIFLYLKNSSYAVSNINTLKKPPGSFQAKTITFQNIPKYFNAIGTIESKNQAILSSQITGTIASFIHKQGSKVLEGQPIIHITNDELDAQQAQALERITAMQIQESTAQSHFNRIESLFKSEAATVEEFEQANQQLIQAQSYLKIAQKQLIQAQIKNSYTLVKAPFEGLVSNRLVNPGDYVWPGKQLCTVYDPYTLRVEAIIPERYTSLLKLNSKLIIQLENDSKHIISTIEEISPQVDPASRSYTIKTSTIDYNPSIYNKMFVTVKLAIGSKLSLFVPKSAIQKIGQLDFLWVKTSKGWQTRYVTLGDTYNDNNIEVLSGLSNKEIIAVYSEDI